jgi:hypothetical protein
VSESDKEFWLISDAKLSEDYFKRGDQVVSGDLNSGLAMYFKGEDTFVDKVAFVYKVRYFQMADVADAILNIDLGLVMPMLDLPIELKQWLLSKKQGEFLKSALTNFLPESAKHSMPVFYKVIADVKIISRIDFELFYSIFNYSID